MRRSRAAISRSSRAGVVDSERPKWETHLYFGMALCEDALWGRGEGHGLTGGSDSRNGST